MKKLIALFFLALACYPTFAVANEGTDRSRPNIWRLVTRTASGISTEAVSVDADADFLPGSNLKQDLGESTHSWKTLYAGSLNISSGIVNVHETWTKISSASKTNANTGNTDVSFFISTAVTSSSLTVVSPQSTSYYLADVTDSSSVPRNLIVQSSCAIGMSTTTLLGSATFYGVDSLGFVRSEVIYFSTTDVSLISTMAVAQSGAVVNSTGVGNIAWAYISSFTVSLSSVSDQASNLSNRINIGWGNKFGLANSVDSSSDVYKVLVDGRHILFTRSDLVIDPVFDPVVIPFGGPQGAPTGGERVDLWYRVRRTPPQ